MFETHEFQREVLSRLELILEVTLDTNRKVKQLMSGSDSVANELANLQSAVANETNVDNSAVALINGIPALIQAAINTALQQGATQQQLQGFANLNSQIMANATTLAAAVTANTPAQSGGSGNASVSGGGASVSGGAAPVPGPGAASVQGAAGAVPAPGSTVPGGAST